MPRAATSVSVEDVSRKYYETAGYSMWISELQLDPMQLIVEDDASGSHFRVPITLSGDSFEFGEPIEVVVTYQDAGKATKASAIGWSSRVDSLAAAGVADPSTSTPPTTPIPSTPSSPTSTPPSDLSPTPAPSPSQPAGHLAAIRRIAAASNASKEASVDATKIREALGLTADASDDDVIAAFLAAQDKGVQEPAAAAAPPATTTETTPAGTLPSRVGESIGGAVLVDPSNLAALRAQAAQGAEAYRRLRENEAEQVVKAAITAGKFAPSREQYWMELWAKDPDGTRDTIKALAANVVPLTLSGYPGVTDASEQDMAYNALYGAPKEQ